jgi:hypothetical protein
MKNFFYSSSACVVLGLLAISGESASGQEVNRPAVQLAVATAAQNPSSDDDKPAPDRWEKAVVEGRPTIRTKDLTNSLKITIKAEKVAYTRYVTTGVYVDDKTPYLDNEAKPIRAASDKPIEKKYDAGPRYYKGLIQIGIDPRTPEELTVKSFRGYDKVTFTDGSVFILKIGKAQ